MPWLAGSSTILVGARWTREAPVEEERKLVGQMKKSASENSALAHIEDAKIMRRPTTTVMGCACEVIVDDELEVDARVDNFINRFKQ